MTGIARAIPRSVLFTPALSIDRVLNARSYDADIHLIDLEDSVPAAAKADARAVCRRALDRSPDLAKTGVRVNALGTIEAVHDIAMLAAGPSTPGLVLMTMVRFPAEVIMLRETLASAGRHPEIYVTVETPEAVAAADTIAAASDGLLFGSADLAATLGIEISWDGLLAARQAMALACARHGVGCVDTANFRLGDSAALAEEIERSRALGFHGKATVHPKELDAINRAFRPGPAELAAARRVAGAVRAAAGGVAVLDGHMIGPPFARKARAALALGQAWAARFGRADIAHHDDKVAAHERV
jgi:citrate lyase subunit beta/citryl-CoA lyase/(S)-citramalyl-CoA lyase